jgi:TPP-dependent pyruvate/acetoin dehydrogenase alpha subunit
VDAGDMIFPSYRQPGAALERGVTVHQLLDYHGGKAFSTWDWRGLGFAPYTIPVGSQLTHATGWAMAEGRRHSDRVVCVFFGDGASSQGEVHEAMNYAGVFDAPVVFVCENNGWAISNPFENQTRASSLFVRAIGYGFEGVRVDGNDFEAVSRATRRAITNARAGGGPTLVEAVTYRMGGHTTSDDPAIYRSPDEVRRWEPLDPLTRFRAVIERRGIASAAELDAMEEEVEQELDQEVDTFLARLESA